MILVLHKTQIQKIFYSKGKPLSFTKDMSKIIKIDQSTIIKIHENSAPLRFNNKDYLPIETSEGFLDEPARTNQMNTTPGGSKRKIHLMGKKSSDDHFFTLYPNKISEFRYAINKNDPDSKQFALSLLFKSNKIYEITNDDNQKSLQIDMNKVSLPCKVKEGLISICDLSQVIEPFIFVFPPLEVHIDQDLTKGPVWINWIQFDLCRANDDTYGGIIHFKWVSFEQLKSLMKS